MVGDVPLEKDDESLITRYNLGPERWVPPGGAAFWLGVDLLRGKQTTGLQSAD
jgi:hypothetical protein